MTFRKDFRNRGGKSIRGADEKHKLEPKGWSEGVCWAEVGWGRTTHHKPRQEKNSLQEACRLSLGWAMATSVGFRPLRAGRLKRSLLKEDIVLMPNTFLV